MKRRDFFTTLVTVLSSVLIGMFSFAIAKLYRSRLVNERWMRIPESILKSRFYDGPSFIYWQKDNQPQILSKKCPHLGCTLRVDKAINQIVCPCHGSRFTLDGQYQSGPAKQDMRTLAYRTAKKGGLEVQLD